MKTRLRIVTDQTLHPSNIGIGSAFIKWEDRENIDAEIFFKLQNDYIVSLTHDTLHHTNTSYCDNKSICPLFYKDGFIVVNIEITASRK